MKNLLFITITLVTIACNTSTTEVIKVHNVKGILIEEYQIDKNTGKKTGWYKRYDAKGNLLEHANYLNDTLNGSRNLYFANGTPRTEETYENGLILGQFKEYYKSGQLLQEGTYKKIDNRTAFDGLLITYHENGAVKEKVTMKGGEEDGPFEEYHENGNIAAKGFYISDGFEAKEHGELELYDEHGELVRKMNCKVGACITTWVKEE